MNYSMVSDVRREFKSVLEAGTVITDDKIVEFQLQYFSLINSYIGTRFSVPVSGSPAVNQQDTLTVAAVGGAGEVKSFSVSGSGNTKTYSYTTVLADTTETARDNLLAVINADKDRLAEATASGTDDIVLQSRVLGFAYALVSISGIAIVSNVVAALGSSALRLLRMIETELTACKIAGILKTKIPEKLAASGVRQDIKDETCAKSALALLRDLQSGKADLGDASLVTTSGGLESSAYAGTFKIDRRQW